MKKVAIMLLAVSLGGCAINIPLGKHPEPPTITPLHVPMKAPKIEAPKVDPQAPATFKQRFRRFKYKHPVHWFH